MNKDKSLIVILVVFLLGFIAYIAFAADDYKPATKKNLHNMEKRIITDHTYRILMLREFIRKQCKKYGEGHYVMENGKVRFTPFTKGPALSDGEKEVLRGKIEPPPTLNLGSKKGSK